MEEIWTPVYCNENYLVSNKGRVKRLKHTSPKGRFLKEKMVKINTSGEYHRVSIYGYRSLRVHQVVYYSFNGGEPAGMKYVVDHINGDKLDNRLENLQLLTVGQNLRKGHKMLRAKKEMRRVEMARHFFECGKIHGSYTEFELHYKEYFQK